MTMTDPIADMLTRLRNANSAYHDSAAMPSSKLKTHIAEILQQEGYIAGWPVERGREGRLACKELVVDLKYGPNRERSIAGVRRVSKPGLRVYAKSTALPKVLGGLGVAIISTSTGLLTDKQADQEGRGRGSPRLRLVRERAKMSRIGRLPIPVPGGVDVDHRRPHGQRQGPQGHPVAHRRRAHHRRARRGRHPAGPAARRRAREPRAARAVPHADRQHGHRRHRGLQQDPRDRRRRLPRAGPRLGPRVRPRLQPPGAGQGPGGHHLHRRVARPACG